ncbi:hypothetical protein ACA910_001749 [Epithemia clementina (nom. ined.)]
MAEREDLQRRYAYHEMSNKVEQADRRGLRRGEATGEVESLRAFKGELPRMGDRLLDHRQKKQEGGDTSASGGGPPPKKKVKRSTTATGTTHQQDADLLKSSSSKPAVAGGGGGQSIADLGNLTGYHPSTDQAKHAYEGLLTLLGSKALLGNQNPEVLRDSAEEVLTILTDDSLRDPDKHEHISRSLTGKGPKAVGGLAVDIFTNMVRLAKDMPDFGRRDDEDFDRTNKSTADKLDDNMGVAVLFDDSDDEGGDNDNNNGDSDVDADVVIDPSTTSSEDEEEPAATGTDPLANGGEDEEKLVQGTTTKKKSSRQDNRILSVHEIDAHYLQRQLSNHFTDADQSAKIAQQVLEILDIENGADLRECENRLIILLGLDLAGTIKLILNNRVRVWACVTLKQAQSPEERQALARILEKESSGEGALVWQELNSQDRAQNWTRNRMKGLVEDIKSESISNNLAPTDGRSAVRSGTIEATSGTDQVVSSMDLDQGDDHGGSSNTQLPNELDLEVLAFKDGAHTMSNKNCTLPDKSWRAMRKGYEEVHVPATRSIIPKDEKLVEIKSLPAWTHVSFKGMDMLNRVQSKVCDTALRTSENMLLCAPTGAGKTNVAWLTMLNILGQYRLETPATDGEGEEPRFDLEAFKIIYVAPMKALVQEQVKNFSQRFKSYGVTVNELSGDSSLTRQQIAETQVLVTTPEKFDVVTRQGEGRAFTQLVKLVIIDEIHLLHDERGPVLESIVARTIRQIEATGEPIRLVGLSATLPNYTDVAALLRVNPDKGLYFFDQSFRPVPLQMQYIGITEKNAFKRMHLQNEICYEKALEQRRNKNQMLIFVHSRIETGKTVKALQSMAMERNELTKFVRDGSASQEILREEASSAKNADLKDVLPYGFAIHHAGMAREDRALVEDLFAAGHVSILCTTATLAWGVNLPAHAVIIKGTQVYNPSKGKWAELSPLDVLQMLGRAGRPQYDIEGEGIILTQHSELQYYLSLTNLQLPVESQMIQSLPDHMNAEIALGSIQNISEAIDWLGYTFLFIRMLRNPSIYGMGETVTKDDPRLKKRRLDLVHTAAVILEKSHLVHYDRKSGALQSTPLGRVASQFYINSSSMALYNRHMRPTMTDIDLLRLFSLSGEFTHMTVRDEEKLELSKLAGRVPIPVKENPAEPSAKVNILLQSYISRLKLEGFALVADMAFIRQSAARIMRALFEISLRRGWSSLTKLCLDMSNMVSFRVWRSQSPLRQFPNVPEVVARKLERKSDIEWDRYTDLTASDLGELVGVPKLGRGLHKLVNQYPRLEVSAQIQPITRSLLRVEATLVPAFHFDIDIHGYQQLFHIFIEDVNGENILHHELFSLRSREVDQEHLLTFTVPIMEPLHPAYFIRVKSDRWLHSVAVLPISFNTMILPAKFPPPTELLDLQPLLPQALGEPALSRIFTVKEFTPIQSQTFHELFKTDRNCIVLAPSGSGKSICGVFAILRMLSTVPDGTCVYVAPHAEIADATFSDWQPMLGKMLSKGAVEKLTGDTTSDLKILGSARVVIATVKQWDVLSRRWRQRKAVQNVALMIFDELHFLGGGLGPTMEVVISRTRLMSSELRSADPSSVSVRIVGLGYSIANARDVGEWMGVTQKSLFNFSPKARPSPLEIYFQSFEQSNFASRLLAMAKPVFNAVDRHLDGKSAIVFVPSRRQAQLTAIDLMMYRGNQGRGSFLGSTSKAQDIERLSEHIREPALQQVLSAGIGFVYRGMIDSDWQTVMKLFGDGVLRVLVCPGELCWAISCRAHLTVIMGTESYDGKERRHVDYPISDLIRMQGRNDPSESGKCMILCHSSKKDSLKKLLHDPVPIESHLDSYLHDPLNAEIVSKNINSMQDAIDYLTWTFLYRRLGKNPTYYGLRGTSNSDLSEHLSEMIEAVVTDLEESKCCKITDEGDISPLNLGMIASYYYVQYRTIELVASSVTSKTKIRGVLEILCASWEFSSLPMRYGEEKTLRQLARTLPHQAPDGTVLDANAKALILLQCHFGRILIPSDLRLDLEVAVKDGVNLIQAIVDVLGSNSWLKPALAAMELSQMLVQGLSNKDNVLKQIPHFDDAIVERCSKYQGEEPIESVFDILTLEEDVRNELLQLPESKMADVAVFCNNYPSIDVSFKVTGQEEVASGDVVEVLVTLERELDDDLNEEELGAIGRVMAPLFPGEKREFWWVVIGDATKNSLLALKRTNCLRNTKVRLEFLAPDEPGDYNLSLFCMSDSYLGCDQEYSIPLSVKAVSDSDEDDSVDS